MKNLSSFFSVGKLKKVLDFFRDMAAQNICAIYKKNDFGRKGARASLGKTYYMEPRL